MGSGVEGEPVGNYLIFISLGSHGVAGSEATADWNILH